MNTYLLLLEVPWGQIVELHGFHQKSLQELIDSSDFGNSVIFKQNQLTGDTIWTHFSENTFPTLQISEIHGFAKILNIILNAETKPCIHEFLFL